ncbi:MAG: tRNA (adenosine(37)-N6)-dimethylallyltransferase MiaA [Candidatus Uhrbacteria bacterium]|nr:tRNA (adenosine(37)-N6)-dimethylallyltransferase MiaA [Candidatus Uhrbacteria bacterium]
MVLPKIVCVVGPTASGKTDVGVAIAKMFDGEVVAADSRTVYREMNIGTAKPSPDGARRFMAGGASPEEATADEGPPLIRNIHDLFKPRPMIVDGVPHWGFDLVDPGQPFTVKDYQMYADAKIADIVKRRKLPVIVGGTGLYIKSLIDRPTYSSVAPNAELRASFEAMTNQELVDAIGERDPDAMASIDEDNRVRLIRALEIIMTTGRPLSEDRGFEPAKYDALQIGIEVPREELYVRIDERVAIMVAKGLVEEVRLLKERYGCEIPAMSGIGYRQICDFFDGKMKLRDALARMKYDTRHYAKRQETWFKGDERVVWVTSALQATKEVEHFIASYDRT